MRKRERYKNAGKFLVKRNFASVELVHNNVHQHAKVKERVKCARGYIIRRFVKNQKI